MSGDTRFTNLSLGRYANFFANTSNVFAQADTTPDVTNGVLFFSNNTTNTIITHFDLTVPGPIPGGSAHTTTHQSFEGKIIYVVFLDDSTGLANSGRLLLSTSDGLQGANNAIQLLYHNSSWIELSRSQNNTNILNISSMNMGSVVGASTTGVINVRGNISMVNIQAEVSSNATLRRAINGYQGQVLTLVASHGSDALIIVNSAAADTFVVTSSQSTATQFRLASSAAISFIRAGNRWLEIRPVSGNSSGQLQ